MRERAKAVIDEVLAPLVAADGGRIELVDVVGTRVTVRLSGTCLGCPGRPYTLGRIVEPLLRRVLARDIVVDAATD